jgi:hypothetical protein
MTPYDPAVMLEVWRSQEAGFGSYVSIVYGQRNWPSFSEMVIFGRIEERKS